MKIELEKSEVARRYLIQELSDTKAALLDEQRRYQQLRADLITAAGDTNQELVALFEKEKVAMSREIESMSHALRGARSEVEGYRHENDTLRLQLGELQPFREESKRLTRQLEVCPISFVMPLPILIQANSLLDVDCDKREG